MFPLCTHCGKGKGLIKVEHQHAMPPQCILATFSEIVEMTCTSAKVSCHIADYVDLMVDVISATMYNPKLLFLFTGNRTVASDQNQLCGAEAAGHGT